MIGWGALLVMAATGGGAHTLDPGYLPACSNRVVNEVVRRAGCTLGDTRCWNRSGGFCTDWVEGRARADQRAAAVQWTPVDAGQVRKGDVAVFVARAHYAYVERVIVDAAGRPVAVDVSEYNYGACWVDREVLVTDQYKQLHRRAAVSVAEVDGGFLRPQPAG